MDLLFGILQETWSIWMESAVFFLFGFLIAALVHVFLPMEKVVRYLGKGKIRSVIYAALAGIPLPLCSCSVLPVAMSLKKRGANNGATLSFLISEPISGPDSIALTYTLMDPIMTIARVVSGFFAALIAGIIENFFGSPSPTAEAMPVDDCCSSQKKIGNKIKEGFRYAFVDLMRDIAKWFLAGMLLAGVITTLVPDDWIALHLGGGLSTMLLMLAVGIPLYICASASTPVAAALILKGMSPGAALVFLLAGPATNAATITVVMGMMGKRATVIYLASIAVVAVASGLLIDQIYLWLNIQPVALAGHIHELFPAWLNWGSSILLLALLLNGLRRSVIARER
ncbi:MAG: permease [Deltaproteobacteria bacterium]|nr:permease [Deltaproteobacteria bacterium]